MLFFVAASSWAQKVTVTGNVKDEEGTTLIGATILVKGTKMGTTTDFYGNYSISVEAGQTLVFSFIGMKPEEKKIKTTSKKIDVVLLYETHTLEDVVVIGYGSGKKIGTTIGSVAKVSGKDIAKTPVANVMESLQGKVAGLSVNATSGSPGAAPIILLHGIGTLHDTKPGEAVNSSPLFVVDGLPIDARLVSSLNPDDFESVTVLKDASATSIYGTRAAYGVIYITTKKGSFEQDPEVSVSTQIGFSTLASRKFFEDLLTPTEYMDFFADLGYPREFLDGILERFPNHTRWDKIYHKNSSLNSQTNVSVSGGGKKVTYYISAGQFQQGGTRVGSNFERYNINSNIDAKINDWLSAGLSFSTGYTISISDGGQAGHYSGPLALPFYTPYDENGKELEFIETFSGAGFYHPNYIATKLFSTNRAVDIVPNAYVLFEPIKNLKFKSQMGVSYSVSLSKSKELPSYPFSEGKGSVSRSSGESIDKTITNTLEYAFSLGDNHRITALLGQESVSSDHSSFLARSRGQINDELTTLTQGKENLMVNEGRVVQTFNSVFSRLDYSYDGKYYADASFRRDGASSFGADNRYANFWALGLMWNVKNENFLKDANWLNELRLKVSTGTSGSTGAGGPYASYSLIDFGQYNNRVTYFANSLGNPKLRWEKQFKTTIGMNIGLFDRVNLGVDVYERQIKDMYFTNRLPLITGFSLFPTNLAKLQNRGLDVTLSVRAYTNAEKTFHISPYLNFNYNDIRVLEVQNPNGRVLPSDVFASGYEKGSTLTIFAPIFKGVNPQNGDAEWYLPSENKMVTHTDENQITNQYDAFALSQNTGKKSFAPWNGGFGVSAAYETFTFDIGFSFSSGRYLVNSDRRIVESTSFGTHNLSRNVFDYWRKEGDIARNPRRDLQFTREDSRLIEDASFIRLKNINLGYSLPRSVTENLPVFKGMRFYLSARNLLTFTNFTGADPEFQVSLATGGYPSSRQYVFGVELKF